MRVTIIDETLTVSEVAHRVLSSMGVKTTLARWPAELPLLFQTRGTPDLLVVNVTNELTGWEVAARTLDAGYRGRLLAFVDEPDDERVRGLTQLPQVECVVRPNAPAPLEDILRKVVPTLRQTSARRLLPAPRPAYHGIIGASPQMCHIFARIDKVAAGDVNVCIHGESGTGKELIARAIHYASGRRDRPLITLDCTTIPDGLMESYLFGHVKGAFTGATEHRDGVFALADTGTLFIDELGELSPRVQAKLLRVIQSREFCKVGGTKLIRTDIRLITATNKDLKTLVAEGRFRDDLYYRVAVFMINVPALRERAEDIPRLVDHFLQRFAAMYARPKMTISPAALERLIALPWPGNVRQLENLLEQAVVLAEGDTLTDLELFGGEFSNAGDAVEATLPGLFEAGLPLSEVERRHILRTLHKAKGNRSEAARMLRISIRCLQYKLKAYGRDVDLSNQSDHKMV